MKREMMMGLVLVVGSVGCSTPEVANGQLQCAEASRACPDGFHCATDGTCWRDGDDPPTPDGPPASPEAGDGPDPLGAVAASLAGLVWKLPCGTVTGAACNTAPNATATAIVGGTPGTTYDITVHLRGVVEQKAYTGGCADGFWLAGGAPVDDGYNVFQLTISSPPQTYFVNQGESSHTYVDALDLTRTFRADAGATVTLYLDAGDGAEIKNVGMDGTTPVEVAGVPSALIAQPYAGQFVALDVTDVKVDPFATGSPGSGSPGGALAFAGGQRVAIGDAAALHPTSLTAEAWATYDGANGSYQSIVGKATGSGPLDSFTLWVSDGQLAAGVVTNGMTGAAHVPFSAAAGAWHHYAMTYDGAATRTSLYVDGQLVACAKGQPAPTYDASPLFIGADLEYGMPDGWWKGAIDEVRVWSAARSGDQIWADMHAHALGATPGLLGEWTFDEGAGQTASDSSGHGHTGVLGGTMTAEAADPQWIPSTVPH